MGLNMNYKFLSENFHSPGIQKHTKYQPSSSIYSETYMMQALTTYRQSIREACAECGAIPAQCTDPKCTNMLATTADGVSGVIQNAINAMSKMQSEIETNANLLIEKLSRIYELSQRPDSLCAKYPESKRHEMLARAFKNSPESITVNGCLDVKPELLNKDFPAVSCLNDNPLFANIQKMCINGDNQEKGSSLFHSAIMDKYHTVSDVDRDKARILSGMFGRYYTNTPNTIVNAQNIAMTAFGKDEMCGEDVPLTTKIYIKACENISLIPKFIECLEVVRSNYVFREAKSRLESLLTEISSSLISYRTDMRVPLKTEYCDLSKKVSDGIQNAINTYSTFASIYSVVVISKMQKINHIISSSQRIIEIAHDMIYKNAFSDDLPQLDKPRADINAGALVAEIYEMQDMFNAEMELLNEMNIEEQYDPSYKHASVLLEEGETANNGGANNGTSATTTPAAEAKPAVSGNDQSSPNVTSDNKSNTLPSEKKEEKKKGLLAWLKRLIDSFFALFTKFKERITILIVNNGENQKLWKDNKEWAKTADLSEITVSDWHNYNFKALAKETTNFLPFNVTADYLKSDEALEKKILETLSDGSDITNILNDERLPFGKKVEHIYSGSYIEKDKTVALKDVKEFNKDDAYKFVDGMMTMDTVSDVCGRVGKAYSEFNVAYNNINNNYDKYLSDLNNARGTKVQTQESANIVYEQNSNVDDDPFSFNLAKHFDLPLTEADFGGIGKEKDGTPISGGKSNNNDTELNDMIKRYYSKYSAAISAKLTASVAAYRQYWDLFRYVINKKLGSEKNGGNNQEKPANNENTQNADNANSKENNQKKIEQPSNDNGDERSSLIDARNRYQQYLDEHPNSKNAPAAKIAIREINKEIAALDKKNKKKNKK